MSLVAACHRCGAALVAESFYCHRCGVAVRCPGCGTGIAAGGVFCHHCGRQLGGGRGGGKRLRGVVGWLIATSWLACVAAVLLILPDTETVVVTGPILAGLGLGLLITSGFARYPGGMALGAAHVGICLLFVILVVYHNWSPRRAWSPFLLMGTIYTITALPLSVLAWWKRPAVRVSPWHCRRCNYFLYGLVEPRCPECGTAFDPTKLAGQVPPAELIGGGGGG